MTTHNAMPNNNIHEGRNVRRFREMRRMKQDALAAELGDDWNQQRVSLLEQKETIDVALLKQIAQVLDVPVEAFQNLDEDQAINIIASTIDNSSFFNQGTININAIAEIQKLHEEKIALFERMLKEKDEMMARLEKLMEGR